MLTHQWGFFWTAMASELSHRQSTSLKQGLLTLFHPQHRTWELIRHLVIFKWLKRRHLITTCWKLGDAFCKVSQSPAFFLVPFSSSWARLTVHTSIQHLAWPASHVTCEGMNEWTNHTTLCCQQLDLAAKDSELCLKWSQVVKDDLIREEVKYSL